MATENETVIEMSDKVSKNCVGTKDPKNDK